MPFFLSSDFDPSLDKLATKIFFGSIKKVSEEERNISALEIKAKR